MFLTDKWDHVLLATLQFVSGPKLTLRISASWDDSHLRNYAVRGLCKVSECWSGCSGDQCGHSGILGLLFPQMRLVCTSQYRRLEIMERYRGYLDIPFSDLKFTDDEPLGIGTSSKVGMLLSHLPFTCRNAVIYLCTLVLRNLQALFSSPYPPPSYLRVWARNYASTYSIANKRSQQRRHINFWEWLVMGVVVQTSTPLIPKRWM